MPQILLESDFLTVDLNALINKTTNEPSDINTDSAHSNNDNGNAPEKGTPSKNDNDKTPEAANTPLDAEIDWAKELKNRQAKNSKLGPEAKLSSGAVENKFWEDYFATVWETDLARVLRKIELFQKDLKILGFNKKTNPMLAFFSDDWVQNNLIRGGLINSEKYKVLHNAASNPRTIADSEFLKNNKYNILYCKDLYRKPSTDMVKYLDYQKNILSPTASFYSIETKKANIRVFLQTGQKDVRKEDAKLNSLKEVAKLASNASTDLNQKDSVDSTKTDSKTGGSQNNVTGEQTSGTKFGLVNPGEGASKQELSEFVLKLKTVAQVQAAIQYLTMNTNAGNARTALLSTDAFKKTSMEDLMKATIELSRMLSSLRLSGAQAENLVDVLLHWLEGITGKKKPEEAKPTNNMDSSEKDTNNSKPTQETEPAEKQPG